MPGPSGASSVPLVADRLAVPARAAVVKINDEIAPGLVYDWDHPERGPGGEPAEQVKGYFRVQMQEWGAAVRKMMRSGLLVPLRAESSPGHLAAGASVWQNPTRRTG